MQKIFQTDRGLVMKVIHSNECVFAFLPSELNSTSVNVNLVHVHNWICCHYSNQVSIRSC